MYALIKNNPFSSYWSNIIDSKSVLWNDLVLYRQGISSNEAVEHQINSPRVSRRHCTCWCYESSCYQSILDIILAVSYRGVMFFVRNISTPCNMASAGSAHIPSMLRAIGVLVYFRYRNLTYRQTSNISRTLVGNKLADHSDVVGAAPALLQLHLHSRLASMD